MRPLAVLTGILLGSCFAISLGLLVVAFLYSLNMDYDYIRREIPRLLVHASIFCSLTAIAALTFWATLRERWWLWYSQALLWLGLGLMVYYYWPE